MRENVRTHKAPAPVGPYSQAVKAGDFLFTSGQVPLDIEGNLMGNDIRTQTTQALKNLKQVLLAGGAALNQVVKTTVYLKDMNDFSGMNEVFSTFFTKDPPARAAIEAARLPKDVRVEIDAVAYIG